MVIIFSSEIRRGGKHEAIRLVEVSHKVMHKHNAVLRVSGNEKSVFERFNKAVMNHSNRWMQKGMWFLGSTVIYLFWNFGFW